MARTVIEVVLLHKGQVAVERSRFALSRWDEAESLRLATSVAKEFKEYCHGFRIVQYEEDDQGIRLEEGEIIGPAHWIGGVDLGSEIRLDKVNDRVPKRPEHVIEQEPPEWR